MRFYNRQHRFYCGIDLHARLLAICVLDQAGIVVCQTKIPADKKLLLDTLAPFRTDVVICVECLFAWHGVADLCAEHKIPFVYLGQVLELLGFVPSTHYRNQVRGPCPIHGSTTPKSRSFAAHLERHCWQCFRCGAGGNALDLWTAATKLPLYETAVDLCRRLQVEIPWLPTRRSAVRSPPTT